jgi:transcriptional regulator
MYQPAHFVEQDPDQLAALMQAAPLATLVRSAAAGAELAADPIPLMAERTAAGWRLAGHVARANPLWREADGQPVLAIFHGAQAYVSPGWYASKAAHGKVVPTWNYSIVQAHGRLRAVDDPAWLRAFLERLVARREDGRAAPWHVADAPEDYIAATLRAIVGIEIEVTRLEGKLKLSQNRPADDQQGVLHGLEADTASGLQPDGARVAADMRAVQRRAAR